jgi:hypothetical protein
MQNQHPHSEEAFDLSTMLKLPLQSTLTNSHFPMLSTNQWQTAIVLTMTVTRSVSTFNGSVFVKVSLVVIRIMIARLSWPSQLFHLAASYPCRHRNHDLSIPMSSLWMTIYEIRRSTAIRSRQKTEGFDVHGFYL